MFSPTHPCPRCQRTVADYTGQPFAGAPRTVDSPTGSPHVCLRTRECHPERLGQDRECLCGAPVYQAGDGRKYERDGSAHFCGEHWLDATPRPTPVHPETVAQLERGFAPEVVKVRPKAATPEQPTAIPPELRKALDGFR